MEGLIAEVQGWLDITHVERDQMGEKLGN